MNVVWNCVKYTMKVAAVCLSTRDVHEYSINRLLERISRIEHENDDRLALKNFFFFFFLLLSLFLIGYAGIWAVVWYLIGYGCEKLWSRDKTGAQSENGI